MLSYADIPKNTDVDMGVYARDTPGGPKTLQAFAPFAKANPTFARAYGNFVS